MERVIVQFNVPGVTSRIYDQIWDELRKAGHSHPEGLHYHVGAQQGDGWMVIDVWESREAFDRFSETLMPILQKVGVNMDSAKPVITPVYYEYDATLVH
jgi:hypothetical protein